MIKLGLSVLLQNQTHLIEGRSIGLITNAAGVDEQLRDNVSLFANDSRFRLAALFAPEHGLWATAQDGVHISHTMDGQVPIYSLYGDTRKPTAEMLKDIDVLLFDLQGVGVRFYTYVSTLALAMEAAAAQGISFLVLDRPNPINGLAVEGNVLDSRFTSFVGIHPMPIRHGMTVGELARFLKTDLQLDIHLEVVAMQGWRREMWYDDTGLFWVPPSPNMPTLTTAILYPGTCFIEGVNLSEGRGTTKPFELIGAPWIDAYKLADALNSLELAGIYFRPVRFTPVSSKYASELCQGVQAHVLDRNRLKPIEIGLQLIHTTLKLYPDEFQWRRSGTRYFFDLLAGTDEIRKHLSAGDDVSELMASWEPAVTEFQEKRAGFLLYD